jgi:fucose 4-O-acetylase-like acetyltransferase
MDNSRPNYLDYSKAIGIYIVVFGHYVWYLQIPFFNNLLWNNSQNVTLFHMPLFFIIAGMLYKTRSVKEELKKSIQSLLIPYFIIHVICLVIYFFIKDISMRQLYINIAGILSGGDFYGARVMSAGPLWFVFSLFCIKMAVSCYNHITNINKGGGTILLLLLFVIAGITIIKGNIFPFRIDSSSIGLLFFIIGFKCKRYIEKLMSQKIAYLFLIAGISFFILVTSAYCNINYDVIGGGLSINACRWGKNFVLFVSAATSGTLLLFIICRFFARFKNNIIMKISNGTIIILGFHNLFYLFFQNIITSDNFFFAVLFSFFVLLLCYVMIILSTKYFPILLGGRDLNYTK